MLYMVIHGYTWLYMVIHGYTWLYMVIHGYTLDIYSRMVQEHLAYQPIHCHHQNPKIKKSNNKFR